MENYIIIILCFASFFAGFVDAVVGGGGLIQTPVALILLPNFAISTITGSLKIPGVSGTSIAAFHYLKHMKMNWKLLLIMTIFSCGFAFLGSELLTHVSNDFMKPLLLGILVLLAIYTFLKKDFGQQQFKVVSETKIIVFGFAISSFIGFYDGFIGPGTGSFLVVAFISLLGFDFLQASANAKMVNVASNIGSISLFILKGKIIWAIATTNGFLQWLWWLAGCQNGYKKRKRIY